MTLPKEVEELSVLLLADFGRVWELVQAELESLVTDWPRTESLREHRLVQVEAKIRELMKHTDDIAAVHVQPIIQNTFTLGALTTYATAGVITEAIPIGAAVSMARDTMADVLKATQYVNESTKTLIREIAKDQLLMHTYVGQTVEQTAKAMRDKLIEHKVHAVTYANGSQHSLSSYTEMLVRTKSAEAYHAGTMQAAEGLDIEFWEVLDGPGCGWATHDDPIKADGMIVTTDEANQYPISHPNCRRTTVARLDIETMEEAATAGRLPDDVWESSRATALEMWKDVKTTPDGTAGTINTRYAELSPAELEHRRLIQARAS